MSPEEISSLAVGNGTISPKVNDIPVAPVLAKPPKTPEQIAAEKDAEENRKAKAEIDALPFTVEAMKAAAIAQFERRLPEYIKNSEVQVRNMVTMGQNYCGFQCRMKGERKGKYQEVVEEHFTKLGFVLAPTDVGFDVELF